MRRAADTRYEQGTFKHEKPLPMQVVNMMGYLLEKEKDVQRFIHEAVRKLASQPDFMVQRLFDQIAKGKSEIGVIDLTVYLKQN